MSLSLDERQLVRDIVAGLKGDERHREYMRVRSKVLRMSEEYRIADNAKQAALGRKRYHANREESRRTGEQRRD